MIILEHLKVERFRLLREIDLHFPQRGSILIQGPNEAGKSTLFESIYFALYGESLTSEREKSGGYEDDDLIQYGETLASVSLTVSIGATELLITRSIERGKGQKVSLQVRRLGMPQEKPITNPSTANARIISELGGIDGETLRNSCLIEQKGLGRLEKLSGYEREATVRKLLGLEKLTRLAAQFKSTEDDERLLAESRERLQLAEVQARIPELSMQSGQLEAALDAVKVSEDLAEVSRQEAEIAEQQLTLEQICEKRSQLRGRQNRIGQLKKADAVLSEIIAAYEAIAEAQSELPELEQQIVELERRERDELPALEQRVRDLSELTRSFGTLERMAADLLTTVNTIKALEQELKDQEHVQGDLHELDEQIIHARLRLEQAQQVRHELEEQHHSARPQLEARLQRLSALSERLKTLRQTEEQFDQDVMHQGLSQENAALLQKVQRELRESEQELSLVQNEAQQLQQQADAIEKRWRQLSIRRQLEEWQRLQGRTQGLTEAEQHVRAAHQHQEQLTLAALAQRRAATVQMGLFIACAALFVLCGSAALIEALHQAFIFATIAGMAALLLAAGAGLSLQTYGRTHKKEQEADRLMQDATSRVSMMVAARETALRMSGGPGGSQGTLDQVEHEIQSLGGTVPRSTEEVDYLLQQLATSDESLADMQQQVTDSRNKALAARNQLQVTMEALAATRKEYARLQDLRKNEGWEEIDAKLRSNQVAIEQLRNELATAVGAEGLPLPVGGQFNPPSENKDDQSTSYETILEQAIKSTEREIAVLDGKMEGLPDLAVQVTAHQDALDGLLARKQSIIEHHERYQNNAAMEHIEHAHEQQIALRDALRSLQDSLRQRVQPMGVSFGQTAISSAEIAARRQLESLHITLGRKLELENRHAYYAALLKDRQGSLSELYRQLAKFSASLGSWIVPPNPFAEALVALRTRCEREMQEANEDTIQYELENMKLQEGACKAKVELCSAEIEIARERMAIMLAQRSRPPAKGYTFIDIAAVWPLVSAYSPQDRDRLEEALASVEQALSELEERELALSELLQTGSSTLDLEQARKRMEQQERAYQTKKRGSLLIAAASERLMRKMMPRTEYAMQQLLTLLTRGRYQDVRLAAEAVEGFASGGALQLSVWEPAAGEYVPKSTLSGGTADQISLALRLAFAIAALPRELEAAPGFVLLDEPFSSFSQERMQALVTIVTGDILGQHFEQVLFISHSGAFDPAMFSYHLYVDDGVVVESNLPAAAYAQDETLAESPPEAVQSPLGAISGATINRTSTEANGHGSGSNGVVPLPVTMS